MPTRYTSLTAFGVLNDGTSEDQPERKPTERSHEVTSQEMGGSGSDVDELPMNSVIYMGRGSFRMEAVAIDPEPQLGVVQAMTGSVTAPLHAAPRVDRNRNSGGRTSERHEDGAPPLKALFASQVDVPLLAAPTGSVSLQAPVVTLSRGLLAMLCGLVLLCGIVVGTAVRHLFASPAPLAVVAVPAVAAAPAPALAPPAIVALPSLPTADTAPPSPPPVVAVAAPVTIHVRAKAVSKAAPAPVAAPKAWVDPWAE
jgi:hypothetical protein